jgi:hypothetical protein
MAEPTINGLYIVIKTQVIMMVVIAYQIYLAVGAEMLDDALKGVERVSSWPIQALNIGLFVLVLTVCWLYLQSTRKDLAKLQAANDQERKDYVDSLKTMVADMGKIIERNNIIFERIDRRLERLERPSDTSQGRRD